MLAAAAPALALGLALAIGSEAAGARGLPGPETEPAIDMVSLEARLRDTDAIGFFTKLELKAQLDDLVEDFRAHHRVGAPGMEDLRGRFELMVIKVLALVEGDDPDLAADITAAQPSLWQMLTDPVRVAEI